MSPRVGLSVPDDEVVPRDSDTVRSTSSGGTNSQNDDPASEDNAMAQRSVYPVLRQKQVVDDVRWEDDQLKNSDGEADDDEEPGYLDFASSENHVYSGDAEDAESFHDFPDTPDGSDAGSYSDPDDPAFDDPFGGDPLHDSVLDLIFNRESRTGGNTSRDALDSSEIGQPEEEERFPGSSKDNGKAPSALNDTIRHHMVKMLSENKDAFFSRSSWKRRRELWETFAKRHPHHSVDSYMQCHASHYRDLERDARNMQKTSGGLLNQDVYPTGMDEELVFHNPRKGSCPIYVQDDVSVGLIKPTKDLIENFGGLVTEDPQKAIVIIIVDRNTHLGSRLITNYAGESSVKGVVDQVWALESIRKGRMLGPPDWGGYALHRHTAQTYFDDTGENTSTVTHTASSATADARRSPIRSTRHTPFPSLGSSGNLPSSRTSVRPSPLPISQRPSLSQQTPSKQSQESAPQNTSAQLLRSPNASQPRRASSHVRDVRTEIGLRRETEAHRRTENDSSTPQPPAEEDSHPLGKSGRFRFTDAEAAYIRARTERAQANKPLSLSVLAADISKAIPWHSPVSITSYIQKKEWNKELLTRKRCLAGGSESSSNRHLQGITPIDAHIDTLAQEWSRSVGSPTGGDENQASAEEIIDASDTELANKAIHDLPPEAPPRHNICTVGGKYTYTDADKEFIVKYLEWAERNNIKSLRSVYKRINKLMPWHSVSSIETSVYNYPNLYRKPNTSSKSSRLRQQRTGSNSGTPATGLSQSQNAEPQKSTGSNKDSRVKEGTSGRIEKQARVASLTKGKASSTLTEAVIKAMVLVLKENPESHWAQNNRQKRTRLWSDFAKIHPNHSADTYYQYHIQHHKRLESAARELIEDESSTGGDISYFTSLALEIADGGWGNLESREAEALESEVDFNDGTAKVFSVAPWFNKLAVDIVCGKRLDNMGPAIAQLLEEGALLSRDWPLPHGGHSAGTSPIEQPSDLSVDEIDRALAEQLEGLPEGVLPLEPISKSFQIALPNGEKKTVKRTQLPLTAAYAFTDYPKVTSCNSRETIRSLRDFDASLFVNGGCPILKAEDERLEDLDARTKKWWGETSGQRTGGVLEEGEARRKGSCPTYIQDDVPVGLVKPLKDLIENFGGLVTEDPQKAIIIVIIDRNTHMGTKLITDYAGESSGKGVVDQAWVLDSIRQGHILGPPAWGGYAQQRHTAQTYFDNPDENMPSIAHTSSLVTIGARSYFQSTGSIPLSSSGSPGSSPPSRTPVGPSVSQKHVKSVPQRPLLARQTSSKEPRTHPPRRFGAQPSKSTDASRPQKTKHAQDVRVQGQIPAENEAGCQPKRASPTPQPPPEEDKVPIGKKGTFSFTKAEQDYIRSLFERARAGGPVLFTPLAATISKGIPWHPPKSVMNYMYRKKWHIEYSIKETLPAGGSKSDSERLPRRAPKPVPNGTGRLMFEAIQSAGSPTRDDDNESTAGDPIGTSQREPEHPSAFEPPPEAPSRHNMRFKDGRWV
ncbi:hypothetical protein FS837_003169 [Tulasnella sp. UAMH 9824]|nr:hypothetical protein FS837_003169 [Tulasnella sp. UAMH 9824]